MVHTFWIKEINYIYFCNNHLTRAKSCQHSAVKPPPPPPGGVCIKSGVNGNKNDTPPPHTHIILYLVLLKDRKSYFT